MSAVTKSTATWVEELFTKSIVPTLVEYIKIPNKSAMFDPEWRKNGHVDRAVELLSGWAKQHLPEGATLEVVRLEQRTPVIFIDVPATGGKQGDTVMLYGHLDKQPEMAGWREGLGPWTPVLEGDKLTVAAAPTTATRSSPRSRRSTRSARTSARTRDA